MSHLPSQRPSASSRSSCAPYRRFCLHYLKRSELAAQVLEPSNCHVMPPLTFRCSASGGCVFEREVSKGNDDRLFYFTSSNATFSFKIGPDSAGLSVIMFANCYNNYLGVSYSVTFDIENPGGVRVSAGARAAMLQVGLFAVSFASMQVMLRCLQSTLHSHVLWLRPL